MIENKYTQSAELKQKLREIHQRIEKMKKEKEEFDFFEDEVNVLNGNDISEITSEVKKISEDLGLRPILRREIHQLVDCDVASMSLEMESDASLRLQVIGVAAIKLIDDEGEYTRLRRHIERDHHTGEKCDAKFKILGTCRFGQVCPFGNSSGEGTKYCARLENARNKIKYFMRQMKMRIKRKKIYNLQHLFINEGYSGVTKPHSHSD